MRQALCLAMVALCAGAAPATSAAPSPCGPRATVSLVRGFVAAYNRGDWWRVNRLWAGRGSFRWYSAHQAVPEVGHEIYARRKLIPYFKSRHMKGERLGLLRFRWNGTGGGVAHFEYRIVRSTSDLGGSNFRYEGKGAAECLVAPSRLIAWSMSSLER